MRKTALAIVIALPASGSMASAADLRAPVTSLPAPLFTWSGAHVGVYLGAGSGTAAFTSPTRASLFDTTAPTPFAAAGGQIGYDYQIAASRVVVGAEADGGAIAGLNGSTTCLDTLTYVVPFTCRTSGKALATGTGRVGYAFGPGGRTLGYVRGGVAALFRDQDVTAANSTVYGPASARFSHDQRVGYIVGAGVEQALSPAWSVRLEYDYMDFGSRRLASPPTQQLVAGAGYQAFAAGPVNDRQSLHALKLALNYHLGASSDAPFLAPGFLPPIGAADLATPAASSAAPAYGFASGYSVEVGGRYWYSFGRFQKDLGATRSPNNVPISRLTYQDNSHSGEFFGRIDTPARIFVKGFVGGGGQASGHMNDEDFRYVGPAPYSNAILSQRGGTIAYGTIDVGYSLFKSASTNLGAFVGYNRYSDDRVTFGCTQLTANAAAPCGPATAVAPNQRDITQTNTYNSLRLGLNGDVWLDRLRLQADAAYLPLAALDGSDVHRFQTTGPRPDRGHGQGVQLELIASYYLTPNWSVGVGGRFWGLWDLDSTETYAGDIRRTPTYSQRFGLTAQTAYRFDAWTPTAVVAKY